MVYFILFIFFIIYHNYYIFIFNIMLCQNGYVIFIKRNLVVFSKKDFGIFAITY